MKTELEWLQEIKHNSLQFLTFESGLNYLEEEIDKRIAELTNEEEG